MVLASPRFLFRIEGIEPVAADQDIAAIDEYSLASRLSYFLWSTMPDDELTSLAAGRELRKDLPAQVKRHARRPALGGPREQFHRAVARGPRRRALSDPGAADPP